MRTAAQGVRSTAYRGLSRLSRAVLIVAVALSVESCRSTRKLTQTEQTRQTVQQEASASLDSSASLSQQVESLRMVTVTGELWTEQAWLITPLPDGSLQVKGKTHEKRRSDSVVQAKAKQTQTAAATVKRRRTQQQESKNKVRTASKQSSNDVWDILWIWLAGIIAIVGIGYYLVKHQNK